VKKWWFPFYTWSISVSAVNAWRLRNALTGKKEPYLDFLRELVIELFTVNGRPSTANRRQSSLLPQIRRYKLNICI
jgi:hypothetical protein